MICVSIGRGRHKHVKAEHRFLAEQGIKLVELRLDIISTRVNIPRLLRDRPCPVIATCRRKEDGGRWEGSETDRRFLLRTAVAEGVDYVDLEEDVAKEIPRFGKTKRIVSMHDFFQTPDNLAEIHARLAAADADIVKLATMANCNRDNLRMLSLVNRSKIPTIGICMGEIGTPTRILGRKFGAPLSYATIVNDRSLAPGQLGYMEMRDVYHYDRISPKTEIYGVIADPVAHSMSPVIHNAAFKEQGIDAIYLPFRVPREDLNDFFADRTTLGIRGLSVTIPHKEAVLDKLTKVDDAVKGIGAANTIVFDGDDSIGYNTDYRGSMDSLDEVVADHFHNGITGRTALILGAGGVVKAVAYGLARRGANVVIAGRTHERAKRLADRLKCRAVEWNDRHSIKADILVNGTPVGMHPDMDDSPFEKHYLRPNMVVFDTVYNPEQTLLIKQAREQSCKVITGVEMFVGQAALQFELFTSDAAPRSVMADALRRSIGAANY